MNSQIKATTGEQERTIDILREICKLRLDYPENRKVWDALESALMHGYKHYEPENLARHNNHAADIILEFLVKEQQKGQT